MTGNVFKKGRKIEGFFGLFDVLGYGKMMEKTNLDDLIGTYTNILMDIENVALSLEGLNKSLLLAPIETKSFAFSDTFVLYQDMPKGPVVLQTPTINVFIGEACYLLRLAFERGIPLRGAISYGKYYIQEEKNCFIGYPVIESYRMEKSQEWSGAILCKSASEKLKSLHSESMKIQGDFRGLELEGFFSPFHSPFYVKYPIPYKSSSSEGIALCWHDEVLDFMDLNKIRRISTYDLKNIGEFVREKFEAHGKSIDKPDAKIKMENTATFLGTMQTRYSLLKLKDI